jgi:hypothetical protein
VDYLSLPGKKPEYLPSYPDHRHAGKSCYHLGGFKDLQPLAPAPTDRSCGAQRRKLMPEAAANRNSRLKAYLAHIYTATGIIWAFLAAFALLRSEYAVACIWLMVLVFSLLTVLPLRFVYPSHAPRWTGGFIGGAIAWLALTFYLLNQHPHPNHWLVQLSLLYPALYIILSVYLDFSTRTNR